MGRLKVVSSPSNKATAMSVGSPPSSSSRAVMSQSPLMERRVLSGDRRVLSSDGLPRLFSQAPAMASVLGVLETLAASEGHVLITGELGAGKEVLARWLHAMSERAGPFVPVRAALDGPSALADAFDRADGGAIFIDGLTALADDAQQQLVDALGNGGNVRVFASTHVDPVTAEDEGRVRRDLVDLLSAGRLHVPPLRDRRADIPQLARHVLKRCAAACDRSFHGFATDAMNRMLAYDWPGNVRELTNAVERAVLRAQGDTIEVRDLGIPEDGEIPSFETMTLSAMERVLIQKALKRHDGNVSRAARSLGLSRSALYRRLHRHGL